MSKIRSLIVFGLIAFACQEGLGQTIYFVDHAPNAANTIQKINSDGSGLMTILDESTVEAVLILLYPKATSMDGIEDSFTFFVDQIASKMYWPARVSTESINQYAVMRSNLDGSFIEVVMLHSPGDTSIGSIQVQQPFVPDINCDDGNDCTVDTISKSGLCEHENKDDTTPCEDGFFCTINDICTAGVCDTGSVNPVCVGPAGPTGSQGVNGVAGPPGPSGANGEPGPVGLSCWDLDGDGIGDLEEDINGDGNYDALDCQGVGGRLCDDDSDCQDGLFCNGVETCNNGNCSNGPLPCDLENETCFEDTDRCIPADVTPGQDIADDNAQQTIPMCGALSGLSMILMLLSLGAVRFSRGFRLYSK